MSQEIEIRTYGYNNDGTFFVEFKDHVDVNYYPLVRLMRDYGLTHSGGQRFLKRSGMTFERREQLFENLKYL